MRGGQEASNSFVILFSFHFTKTPKPGGLDLNRWAMTHASTAFPCGQMRDVEVISPNPNAIIWRDLGPVSQKSRQLLVRKSRKTFNVCF